MARRDSADGLTARTGIPISRDGSESEVFSVRAVLLAPKIKEAAIAEGEVPGRVDTETGGGAVDPLAGAFELGIVANGGFVDNAVSGPVRPLATPFFIAEGWDQAEGQKNLGEGLAVGDFGFGFDAVFVGVFSGASVRKTLVGQKAAASVGADAEDFRAGAHPPVGGVVEDVGLEAAGGLQSKSGGWEAEGEAGEVGWIVEAEFDFGFDGHSQRLCSAARSRL